MTNLEKIFDVRKISEKQSGNVAFTYRNVEYIGDKKEMQSLYLSEGIAVGIEEETGRIDFTCNYRDYYVPNTMPLSLRGAPDGVMNVLELYPNSKSKIEKVIYGKSDIRLIVSREKESYELSISISKIRELGSKKKKVTIRLEDILDK